MDDFSMFQRKIGYSLALMMAVLVQVRAQTVVNFNGQNFERYSLDVTPTRLLVGQQGYLWIGTYDGVARYDGYSLHYYKENPLDTAGFQGQQVTALMQDHAGGLWVGSNHGLSYLPAAGLHFMRFPGTPPQIQSMAECDGKIWITDGRQLIAMTASNTRTFKPKRFELPDGVVLGTLLTNGTGMIASGHHLYSLKLVGDSVNISMRAAPASGGMARTSDGTILEGSDSGYYVLREGGAMLGKKIAVHPSRTTVLHLDHTGDLWMGKDWGVVHIKLDADYNPVEVQSYPTGYVSDISEDRSGNLFFAVDHAVLKLGWNYNQFHFISLPTEFHNAFAFKFLEDHTGKIWIGTFHALLRYDPEAKSYDVFKASPGNLKTIPHDGVYSFLEDSKRRIWIATGDGVVQYDPLKKEFIRTSVKGLSHHLCEDHDGFIWFVSEDIMYRLDPRDLTITSYEEMGGTRKVISQITIDHRNRLWAWDPTQGLQQYAIQGAAVEPRGPMLLKVEGSQDFANMMVEDTLGRLWVSHSYGVYIIDEGEMKVVRFLNNVNSSLQHDDVFNIVRDKNGHMWLKQSGYGSVEFNPQNFEAITFSPTWLYSGLEGASQREPASVAASGRDGKLFADGTGDFCIFYPDSLKINTIPPNVELDNFLANDQSQSGEPALRASQNYIHFSFAAIQFDNPLRNHYRHFLQGYDHDWSSSSTSHDASYPNLPSGTFHFYVRSANSDGIWSEPKLLANFTILPVWWQTTAAYLGYGVVIVVLLVLFYRIRMSQQLARADARKFKEIDDFKNRFFTNITHEFRTPLTVITGLAEKMDDHDGTLIRRNADQLLALINQILELSKVESNAARLMPEQFDAIQFLKYLLQSFSTLAGENEISVHFESDLKKLLVILDKTKFSLIFQNLLTNAIKFTPAQGQVTVATQSANGQLVISVSDSGVGIEPSEMPFIFDRFYQASNQQPGKEGTGIGLALCRELVRLMNGSIKAESEKGHGSTFTVILPMEEAIRETATFKISGSETAKEIADEKVNILLAEDHEDVSSVIVDVLSQKFDVVCASNGKEALDFALDRIPDLIVSDVMMPEMDGIELTQALKADTRTSHIPIILLTAKVDTDSRITGLSRGADLYLEKPFNSKELLLHVQNLLKLRDALRAHYADNHSLSAKSSNPEDQYLAKLQALISEHLSDDTFGIEEICRDMGISRTQLFRKLKALTGKSASIYVRDLRLAEGRKLLRSNGSSVAEVAYSVGFSDPNYFSRLYAEKYGYPPTRERS